MKYVPTLKNNIAILSICIACYVFSPSEVIPIYVQEVQAKEARTETGIMENGVVEKVQTGGKEDGKKEKFIHSRTNTEGMDARKSGNDEDNKQETRGKTCDAECKVKTLIDIGIRPEIAESLVMNCKALADDPVNCIKIGAFIVKNESGGGYRCKDSNKYNCFGLSVQENYKSYNDGVLHWAGKYNRWWINQRTPDSFYSNIPGKIPVTGYCKTEKQPDGTILPYCKNGHRIAWSVFNKLHF